MKLFLPNEYVKNVYHVQPEDLKKRGIKGVITDLDNTLIEWDRQMQRHNLKNGFENERARHSSNGRFK